MREPVSFWVVIIHLLKSVDTPKVQCLFRICLCVEWGTYYAVFTLKPEFSLTRR
jgi:hypothetical protein